MRMPVVVVWRPLAQETPQVVLGERDQHVQLCPSSRVQEPLTEGVGLRTLGWGFQEPHPQVAYTLIELRGEETVSVMDQEAIRVIRWDGFAQRLPRPWCRPDERPGADPRGRFLRCATPIGCHHQRRASHGVHGLRTRHDRRARRAEPRGERTADRSPRRPAHPAASARSRRGLPRRGGPPRRARSAWRRAPAPRWRRGAHN
jgi:hypothetical protein